MGAQLRFGTAGATGGGFSAQPGRLQPSLIESWAEPKWSWQARAPKTWKDKCRWNSLWSFGCRVSSGSPIGSDGASWGDLSMKDLFEPYSCDGEGTQSKRFLRGTVQDSVGSPVNGALVQGFVTATDAYVGEVQSNLDGTYVLGTETRPGVAHYLVAYKPGSPDIAGTTVNTLTSTNVDGT